jgi:hypothetical protein
MASLIEYSNVYDTALLILEKKGYQVWYDAETQDYCAERNGWDFRSPSPCGLRGVVAIFEFKQPVQFVEYWWREEGPEVYDHLPSHPQREYQPLARPRPQST